MFIKDCFNAACIAFKNCSLISGLFVAVDKLLIALIAGTYSGIFDS